MRRFAAIVIAGALTAGAATASPAACRFLRHYQELEKNELRISGWERVLFSLVKASADTK